MEIHLLTIKVKARFLLETILTYYYSPSLIDDIFMWSQEKILSKGLGFFPKVCKLVQKFEC